MDILAALEDLHKQATTERSHYYTAKVVRDAADEISRLRNIIQWCRRRLPSEGYQKLVDRFVSGQTPQDSN